MSSFPFNKICLIGIGLIGSSLARAIQKHKLAQHISIACNSAKMLERAKELRLGNSYSLVNHEAVLDADLVIFAIPVSSCAKVAKEIAPHLKSGAIVTDVGSTKVSVIKQITPFIPKDVNFIPGHPIAGTEYSGPDAGFADLFMNRWCILTPFTNTCENSLERLKYFWKSCGAQIDLMDAQHHDLVLAIVSHLPHIIAYSIVGTASDLEKVTCSEVISYSASGFRDFTRLAASDPVMWRDICLHNKEAILEMLGRFSEDLIALQRAIRWEDGEALLSLFSRTQKIRQSIIEAGQDVNAPNFGRK